MESSEFIKKDSRPSQSKSRAANTVTVRKDTSLYGMPMPEAPDELLRMDDEGNQRFHTLTPSKQRSILRFVLSGSSVQARIDRAISMIDRLKL